MRPPSRPRCARRPETAERVWWLLSPHVLGKPLPNPLFLSRRLVPCDEYPNLSPGLSHFPRSDKAEISFSLSDNKTYDAYIRSISKFLLHYHDDAQIDQMKYENCGGKYEPEKRAYAGLRSCSSRPLCRLRAFGPRQRACASSRKAHALWLICCVCVCVARRRSSDVHRPWTFGERRRTEESVPLQQGAAEKLLRGERPHLWIQ